MLGERGGGGGGFQKAHFVKDDLTNQGRGGELNGQKRRGKGELGVKESLGGGSTDEV